MLHAVCPVSEVITTKPSWGAIHLCTTSVGTLSESQDNFMVGLTYLGSGRV